MRNQWLQRVATIIRWLFVIVAILLTMFGPGLAAFIYNQGDNMHSIGFDYEIKEINAFENPPPGSNLPLLYTHDQANALREKVNDDFKRDMWDLFLGPLIVLIILAVIDIACHRALRGKRDRSVLPDPIGRGEVSGISTAWIEWMLRR